MPGTKRGGLRAAEINKQRYGKDFYKTIGRLGGLKGNPYSKGFASMTPEQRREAGRKGGKVTVSRGYDIKSNIERKRLTNG